MTQAERLHRKDSNHNQFDAERTRELFIEYQTTGSVALRDHLVEMHINLVRYLASKFANRGEPVEDLQQVGYIGLVKAIERFDPNAGARFTTYATPTIVGEIKRYFRDKGWAMKVPRRLQETKTAVSRAADRLAYDLGRPPTVKEIADDLELTQEEVLEAQELVYAYSPLSLSFDMESEQSSKSSNLMDYLGDEEGGFDAVNNQLLLRRAFTQLKRREQMVIYLRFFENITQSETARILGVSQMHVSRLQNRSLEKLKEYIRKEDARLAARPAS